MRFIHRLSFRSTPARHAQLASLGLTASAGLGPDDIISVVEVDEADPRWRILEAWVKQRIANDILSTEFSEQEMGNAQWFQLYSCGQSGYPYPEDTLKYRSMTYDTSRLCLQCGQGMTQNAPFRIRKERKLRDKQIVQLNWVFDEFFVSPVTWGNTFKPMGVQRRPVHDRNGKELNGVVQISVEEEVSFSEVGIERTVCSICQRPKFTLSKRGFFPKLAGNPKSCIVRSSQALGEGPLAYRAVLVSKELAEVLRPFRGIALRPLAPGG